MTMNRVVITGMGAVTPLANNVRDTWRGLCEGKSGIGPLTLFNAESFPTRIAGEVKKTDFFSRWQKPGARWAATVCSRWKRPRKPWLRQV